MKRPGQSPGARPFASGEKYGLGYRRIGSVFITTTDAIATTAITFQLPSSSISSIVGVAWAKGPNANDYAYYEAWAGAGVNAAGSQVNFGSAGIRHQQENSGISAAFLSVSVAAKDVRVNGIAATTIKWYVECYINTGFPELAP